MTNHRRPTHRLRGQVTAHDKRHAFRVSARRMVIARSDSLLHPGFPSRAYLDDPR